MTTEDRAGVVAAIAEDLCRDDDTMFHHERTDDFPCSACKHKASIVAARVEEARAEAERLRNGLRRLIRDWGVGWDDAEPFDQRDGYRALQELLGPDYDNDPTWQAPAALASPDTTGEAMS